MLNGALGAASLHCRLARRGTRQQAAGRLTVSIGGDGDFNFAPARCGRRAHHRSRCSTSCSQPRLSSGIHVCGGDGRPPQPRRHQSGYRHHAEGSNIDYATVARGYGLHGEGPISDPASSRPALKRAIAVVKSGQPALSTSSPSRAEENCMKRVSVWLARRASSRSAWWVWRARAQDAPKGDAANGQRVYLATAASPATAIRAGRQLLRHDADAPIDRAAVRRLQEQLRDPVRSCRLCRRWCPTRKRPTYMRPADLERTAPGEGFPAAEN